MVISMAGLKTDNLKVGYGKQVVVDNVDLCVEPGKILTLIGPNGCGKSTILKSITRQLKSLGGQVFLGDKDMAGMSEVEIAKSLSMVMTERINPELMTCKDVVATGRYPYTGRLGILSEEDWREVDAAIDLLKASDVQEKLFSQISDGQRQRIMLARAICQNTEIILLDEPTSFLDIRFKLDILSNIRRLAKEKNLAVIMSLHELELAQRISDVIACVSDNGIGKIGTPEEVFTGDYIQKLYGISEENFDPLLGMTHMSQIKGEAKVFVISGGGQGISEFHRLQREATSFYTGILYENDVEFGTAKALASSVVSQKAFYPIDDEKIIEAKQLIDKCDKVICTLTEFGPLNQACEVLYHYAKEQGKL